jgi:hypothetical protein
MFHECTAHPRRRKLPAHLVWEKEQACFDGSFAYMALLHEYGDGQTDEKRIALYSQIIGHSRRPGVVLSIVLQ